MWLVLCETNDLAALWAAKGLAARGLGPVEILPSDLLGCARWEHRVSARRVGFTLVLQDGRTIDDGAIRGVLNRLRLAPDGQAALAAPPDREYGQQELHAFTLSWLAALPGAVLNPASSAGLCGAWRHPAEWALLAARSGFPVLPYTETATAPWPWDRPLATFEPVDVVIALAGRLHGPGLTARLTAACIELARQAATPLLGIQLARGTGGQLWFAAATPVPNLCLGGEALLDDLATVLEVGVPPE